jgi:uncharacterized protein
LYIPKSLILGKIQMIFKDNMDSMKLIFQKIEPVLSAYLFGSFSEGVPNRHSDLDFAVRLRPNLRTDQEHRIRMDLVEMLEDLLKTQVDVVILNDASLLMIHQAFTHGIPLYIRDMRQEEAFRLKKRKEYFDFRYYLEKDRRDLRTFYGC